MTDPTYHYDIQPRTDGVPGAPEPVAVPAPSFVVPEKPSPVSVWPDGQRTKADARRDGYPCSCHLSAPCGYCELPEACEDCGRAVEEYGDRLCVWCLAESEAGPQGEAPIEEPPEWAYTTEYLKAKPGAAGKLRAVATHRTGAVLRSPWWWVDDGSAEADLGLLVAAWEAEHQPSPPVVAPPEAVGAPAGADGTAGGQGPCLDCAAVRDALSAAEVSLGLPDLYDDLPSRTRSFARCARTWRDSRDAAIDRTDALSIKLAAAEFERDAARSRLAETEIDLKDAIDTLRGARAHLADAIAELARAHAENDRLRVEAARPRRWRDRVRGWVGGGR